MKRTLILSLLVTLVSISSGAQEKMPVIGLSATYETGECNVPNTYILAVQRAGGILARERVGHVFIKKTMTDRQAVFGADLSGRHFFRDASFCENAMMGAACVINLLIESGRKLSELIRPLAKYRTSGEVRVACDDPEQTMRSVAAAHPEAEIDYLDGVTVRYPDWWFNLRSPESDGELNLTIEARTKKLVDERLGELQQQIACP